MNKVSGLSMWKKVNILVILCGVIILSVTGIIWKNVDDNAKKIDGVYGSNESLVELQNNLEKLHASMENYLETKTSEDLEEYYSSAEEYNKIIYNLSGEVSSNNTKLMEKNIKNLSLSYLDMTEQTVSAKRSRNIEGYKDSLHEAESLYGYIKTYIYSLNNEQFKNNSEKYSRLIGSFHFSEVVSMVTIFALIVGVMVVISLVISRMTALEESKERLRVENMIKEKEHDMENSLKDARYKYLQAQIHPHFLFNSLNAGAQLSMIEEAPRTYDYIQNLAEFFRYNLKKREEVTLKKEIEQIDHYINILNVRFAGEIHFSKNIDESLVDLRMPGMILQPIVENSVNYGIRNISRTKKIELEVSSMDNLVCICIRDNGVGISQENIDKIMSGENITSDDPGSNGVGMANVINRLKLYYDVDEVIMINNLGTDVGTEVILYLPYNGGEGAYA